MTTVLGQIYNGKRRSIRLIKQKLNGNWFAKVTSGVKSGQIIEIEEQVVVASKEYFPPNREYLQNGMSRPGKIDKERKKLGFEFLEEGRTFLFSDRNKSYK